ncbi:hypothetical protein FQZ37_23925 [Escherichia coli]|uniref:hypothetical protein n=2 Tax=Escherichia coli TaxID=562 RepID=UPI001325A240|nr:hypothetical protein [Escherichia coli]EGZ7137580.1 hypothetical protein [Escherichia coli]EHC9471658.1 hypothetical protein [Escherichia coli]EHC9566753.1 hypothetical protein [Escherichia coli]EHR7866413.1 hypothetical protein [Escherichia coli]EIB1794617.1 hypothetical protein [Escherichia coli]
MKWFDTEQVYIALKCGEVKRHTIAANMGQCVTRGDEKRAKMFRDALTRYDRERAIIDAQNVPGRKKRAGRKSQLIANH